MYETPNLSLTEQNGAWGPNHTISAPFDIVSSQNPSSQQHIAVPNPLELPYPRDRAGQEKAVRALQATERGLTGFTHFLQLFYAGCMHYDLAGCTLTPGERFLLEDEKKGGKTCT